MCGLEKTVVVGQVLYLFACDFGEVFSAVSHVDTPQARHTVQQAVTVGVPQVDAFGAFDNAHARFVHLFMIGKWMQKMCVIKRLIFSSGKRHERVSLANRVLGVKRSCYE